MTGGAFHVARAAAAWNSAACFLSAATSASSARIRSSGLTAAGTEAAPGAVNSKMYGSAGGLPLKSVIAFGFPPTTAAPMPPRYTLPGSSGVAGRHCTRWPKDVTSDPFRISRTRGYPGAGATTVGDPFSEKLTVTGVTDAESISSLNVKTIGASPVPPFTGLVFTIVGATVSDAPTVNEWRTLTITDTDSPEAAIGIFVKTTTLYWPFGSGSRAGVNRMRSPRTSIPFGAGATGTLPVPGIM